VGVTKGSAQLMVLLRPLFTHCWAVHWARRRELALSVEEPYAYAHFTMVSSTFDGSATREQRLVATVCGDARVEPEDGLAGAFRVRDQRKS
jgi:hypothetical protein